MRNPRRGNKHPLFKIKKNNNINPICRLCKQQNETMQHVFASCPSINASMYLPFRHDKVALTLSTNKC